MKFTLNIESNKLLILLIGTDILFVVLHFLHAYTGFFTSSMFSLGKDMGFAEIFQYIKEYWIALLFLLLVVRRHNILYFCWAMVFGFFLIDDSFQIHEKLGTKISNCLDFIPMLGLRLQDYGEILVYASVGLVFFIFIGIAYYLSDHNVRRFSKYVIAMIIVLALFGVLGDMLNIIIKRPWWLRDFFGIVEDGGEMLVMSVIVWFVFRFNVEKHSVKGSLRR